MRHDHTQWLIHFVRDRDPEQDFPDIDEAEAGIFIGGELEVDADAFSVLKTIIRLGGLVPGYSFRSGRTTIYGGTPAVCATEMPLYSFAEYVRSKANSTKVSAYGIAFLKSEFFAAGGRPAIYGLSIQNVNYIENTALRRVFDPAVLPLSEQYRLIAYNPTDSRWIDWSHEREWRWIAMEEDRDSIWFRDYNGYLGPSSGLPLFKGKLDGGHFSRLYIIVWTHKEAEEIQELLTGFFLAGSNDYDTPFDKDLIMSSHIIELQDVVTAVESGRSLNAQTIEGLEAAGLVKSISIPLEPSGVKELVENAFKDAASVGEYAADKYISANELESGACGVVYAVTYDITNPIVQYMIANGIASGPFDGMVIINLHGSWKTAQSIEYNECIFKAISESLTISLGFNVYMHSHLD